MTIREDEIHRDAIIELAGDIVIGCVFLRCEFVGQAKLFHKCHVEDCVNSPDTQHMSNCFIVSPPANGIFQKLGDKQWHMPT